MQLFRVVRDFFNSQLICLRQLFLLRASAKFEPARLGLRLGVGSQFTIFPSSQLCFCAKALSFTLTFTSVLPCFLKQIFVSIFKGRGGEMEGWGDGAGRGEKAEKGVGYVECGAWGKGGKGGKGGSGVSSAGRASSGARG